VGNNLGYPDSLDIRIVDSAFLSEELPITSIICKLSPVTEILAVKVQFLKKLNIQASD
jgi:hypothetical protein